MKRAIPLLFVAALLIGLASQFSGCAGAKGGDAASKTYVKPGEYDKYYAFFSGGHSGQVYVYGIPSCRYLTTIPVFTKFFQDNTIARKFKAQLRELLTTVFAKPSFDATVDNLLPTDWIPAPHGQATSDVPENLQTAIKTFMDTRRASILGLLPQTFTATSSLALQNGFLTTTGATTTQLSGTMDAARTAKVTVNGVTVSQNNYASPGTWTAGSAVTLKPETPQNLLLSLISEGTGDGRTIQFAAWLPYTLIGVGVVTILYAIALPRAGKH